MSLDSWHKFAPKIVMNRMVSPVNLVLNWMYNGSQEPHGLENLGKKKRKRKKDREPVKKRKERYIYIIVIHIPTLPFNWFQWQFFFNGKNHTYDSVLHKNLYLFLAISSNFLSWFVWVDGLG